MNRERIAEVIINSSLWELGKESHNALSELVESIYALQNADRIIILDIEEKINEIIDYLKVKETK